MGAVYFGLHPRLNQDVAVKVLSFSADDADPAGIERFRREAELGARVRSDHLVGVLDVNEDSGLHFIVMEFVEGLSAQELLRQIKKSGAKGLPEGDALRVIIAATEGLAAAHEKDVVHRDVKPGNILIPNGKKPPGPQFHRAKLSDLGLAYSESLDFRMTRTGAVMGTPGFMAPEQVDDSKSCLPSADVFSMGVTLYALLAGSGPFAGKGLRATLEVQHRPIRDMRADVSEPTAALIERCMQKDPAQRYADGPALLLALRSCLAEREVLHLASSRGEASAMSALPLEAMASVAEPVPKHEAPPISIPFAPPATAIRADVLPPAAVHVDLPTVILAPETPSAAVLVGDPTEQIPPPLRPPTSIEVSSEKEPTLLPAAPRTEEVPAPAPTGIDWASSIELWKSLVLELGSGVRLSTLLIPAGSFQMGSPDGEAERGVNEKLHTVDITRPFYIGKFAVTQAEFTAIMGGHRSYFKGAMNPVENVSWFDATIFCDLLTERTGKRVQLPTEAQWEYACRAGTTTPFNCGATIGSNDANFNGTYVYGKGAPGVFRKTTLPVGSFKANAFGLHDMHGNVYEWCRDAYVQNNEKLSRNDPFNQHGAARVVKGGSWYDFPGNCRSACRNGYSDAYPYVGFRVVVDARSAGNR